MFVDYLGSPLPTLAHPRLRYQFVCSSGGSKQCRAPPLPSHPVRPCRSLPIRRSGEAAIRSDHLQSAVYFSRSSVAVRSRNLPRTFHRPLRSSAIEVLLGNHSTFPTAMPSSRRSSRVRMFSSECSATRGPLPAARRSLRSDQHSTGHQSIASSNIGEETITNRRHVEPDGCLI